VFHAAGARFFDAGQAFGLALIARCTTVRSRRLDTGGSRYSDAPARISSTALGRLSSRPSTTTGSCGWRARTVAINSLIPNPARSEGAMMQPLAFNGICSRKSSAEAKARISASPLATAWAMSRHSSLEGSTMKIVFVGVDTSLLLAADARAHAICVAASIRHRTMIDAPEPRNMRKHLFADAASRGTGGRQGRRLRYAMLHCESHQFGN
jgi:hypothetical protein